MALNHVLFWLPLQQCSSEPRQAIVFCSSSLMEHGVPMTNNQISSSRPSKKLKKRLVSMDSYLQSRLPQQCEISGVCADGVVGE